MREQYFLKKNPICLVPALKYRQDEWLPGARFLPTTWCATPLERVYWRALQLEELQDSAYWGSRENRVPVYMDTQQREDTKRCHNGEVKLLHQSLKKQTGLKMERALDVGCGDGRFFSQLLQYYQHIDAFD